MRGQQAQWKGQYHFHSRNVKDCVSGPSTSLVQVQVQVLLRVFWIYFLNLKTNKCCFTFVGAEDFTTIGTLDLKKSHHHSEPSPMRPKRTLDLLTLRSRQDAPGCQCSSCRSV